MENNITLILNTLCIILAVISFRISLGVYGRNKEVVYENRNLRIRLFNYQMEILRLRKLKGASGEIIYPTLGTAINQPLEVHEAVYRLKSKKMHPDVGGSAEAFQRLSNEITEARKKTA